MHRCRNGVQPSVTDLNLTPETEEFSYISQVRLSSQYSAMILDISCYNICSPVINIHKYIKRPLVELHLSIECLFISICLCITSQLVLLGLLINHSLSLSTVACTVDISQNGISEKTHFARSRKHNMKTFISWIFVLFWFSHCASNLKTKVLNPWRKKISIRSEWDYDKNKNLKAWFYRASTQQTALLAVPPFLIPQQ